MIRSLALWLKFNFIVLKISTMWLVYALLDPILDVIVVVLSIPRRKVCYCYTDIDGNEREYIRLRWCCSVINTLVLIRILGIMYVVKRFV